MSSLWLTHAVNLFRDRDKKIGRSCLCSHVCLWGLNVTTFPLAADVTMRSCSRRVLKLTFDVAVKVSLESGHYWGHFWRDIDRIVYALDIVEVQVVVLVVLTVQADKFENFNQIWVFSEVVRFYPRYPLKGGSGMNLLDGGLLCDSTDGGLAIFWPSFSTTTHRISKIWRTSQKNFIEKIQTSLWAANLQLRTISRRGMFLTDRTHKNIALPVFGSQRGSTQEFSSLNRRHT